MANGGHQCFPPSFYKDFPFLKQNRQNVVLSGQFLRQDTFKALMHRIKSNGFKNIVIVGGSHSGFSCAWMLLNGPATYNRNNSHNNTLHKSFPEAPLKQLGNCEDCCTCNESKRKSDSKCSCQCLCLGYFVPKEWDFDHDKDLVNHWPDGSIKILYRDRIRVFYSSVTIAK